jgi:hypothetical protein
LHADKSLLAWPTLLHSENPLNFAEKRRKKQEVVKMATAKQPQEEELGFEILDAKDVRDCGEKPKDMHPVNPKNQQDRTEEGLLGVRIELKWSSGRWYRGTVCQYRPETKTHKILYDDGDIKWYHLPEMVFQFISEEDEWVKC